MATKRKRKPAKKRSVATVSFAERLHPYLSPIRSHLEDIDLRFQALARQQDYLSGTAHELQALREQVDREWKHVREAFEAYGKDRDELRAEWERLASSDVGELLNSVKAMGADLSAAQLAITRLQDEAKERDVRAHDRISAVHAMLVLDRIRVDRLIVSLADLSPSLSAMIHREGLNRHGETKAPPAMGRGQERLLTLHARDFLRVANWSTDRIMTTDAAAGLLKKGDVVELRGFGPHNGPETITRRVLESYLPFPHDDAWWCVKFDGGKGLPGA